MPSEPSVGEHFPLRLVGCEKQSDKLFACVQEVVGTYSGPSAKPNPNLSLAPCATLIEQYNVCSASKIADKKNVKYSKPQERVPVDYRYVDLSPAAKR